MAISKNAAFVLNAKRQRKTYVSEALVSLESANVFDDVEDRLGDLRFLYNELDYVNKHITVSSDVIDEAINEYHLVAEKLIKDLDWPEEMVNVLPQGSASTQTLIRAPNSSKFDIDAICQVDISQVDSLDPIGFFEKVGEALEEFEIERKKRCWNIPMKGKRFYLEFTPSIPLGTVAEATLDSLQLLYRPTNEHYLKTALAVVDNPTKKWKTSNPAGFTQWVQDTAGRSLLRYSLEEGAVFDSSAGVAPVPNQEVELSDTLRVAIRLLKRHRDMCVRNTLIDKEFKPISVVIVTLLTSCYGGLADLGEVYEHPLQLLVDLAELLPTMIQIENDGYHVDNPTVEGENFAERWNQDDGERYAAFTTWCDVLAADLRSILAESDHMAIKTKVREVFGCTNESHDPIDPNGNGFKSGSFKKPPTPAPRTQGLA